MRNQLLARISQVVAGRRTRTQEPRHSPQKRRPLVPPEIVNAAFHAHYVLMGGIRDCSPVGQHCVPAPSVAALSGRLGRIIHRIDGGGAHR